MKQPKVPEKFELRTHSGEVRAESRDDGSIKIVGYGAVFNTLSEPMWGFREQIDPGAFDDVLNDDVRALFNHDSNFVLGRNGTTLRLFVDNIGLGYEIDAPDTQTVRDMVITPMKRGDINQSSFAFYVAKDDWHEEDDGTVIRTILKVKRLFDVSPVTYPAYSEAPSTVRSFEAYQEQRNKPPVDEPDTKWRNYVNNFLETI
ncbi:TPA: HK97 family phage prohead protease [Photobacterium damselae]